MPTTTITDGKIRLIARNWANTGLFDALAKKYSGTLDDKTTVVREIALALAERGVFDDRVRDIIRQAEEDGTSLEEPAQIT